MVAGYKSLPDHGGVFFCLLLVKNIQDPTQKHHYTFKYKTLDQALIMSDAPPVKGIPPQFVYMCRHSITSYFRRSDGRPLDISTMGSPYEMDINGGELDLFDLQVDPPVDAQIRPLMRICSACKRARAQRSATITLVGHQCPRIADLVQSKLIEWRRGDELQNISFIEAAPGTDILGVRNRMERRVIKGPLPTENDNHSSENPSNEDGRGEQS